MKYKKRILLWAIIGLTFFTAACAEEQEGDADISSKPSPTITVVPSETTPGVSGTATPTPTVEQQFDAFTEQLFLDEIVLNTINLHYTLAYPENFGITEYEPGLGSFAIEEMRKSYDEMKQLKKELESFSYEQLTKEQQFTYDIILDYIETELSVEDLLLYTEVLGPVTGYQAQLPVLLAEYKFRTVRDIEDYLALVSKVDDIFTELVEFEKEKSKAGLFMSDYVAESIIDQCRQFIENPEENYMIAVFETEINACEGLSEEEKKNS